MSVFVVENLLDKGSVDIVDEFFRKESQIIALFQSLSAGCFRYQGQILAGEPTAIIVSQNTSCVIAARQHQRIVKVIQSYKLASSQMCKSACHPSLIYSDNRRHRIDFQLLVQFQASIQGIHLRNRCHLPDFGCVMSSQIGLITCFHQDP